MHDFYPLVIFKKLYKNLKKIISVSNSLDPDKAQMFCYAWFGSTLDEARHFVRLDLGPNCLQRLSAEATGRQSLLLQYQNKINASALLHLFQNFCINYVYIRGYNKRKTAF